MAVQHADAEPAPVRDDRTVVADLSGALTEIDRARNVISRQSQRSDREATFPVESVAVLRRCGLMSAAVSRDHGGLGFDLTQLATVATVLGALCGSTAMIWAMHQIQLACLEHSARRTPEIAAYLRRTVDEQLLIASVTSEIGNGGGLMTSKAAVEECGSGYTVRKHAPTVSYATQADAFLITARRSPASTAGDQVMVLADATATELSAPGEWDTMGMRGTCSAGQLIDARVQRWQVLPVPFAVLAEECMIPVSHLLWAAVWCGIAQDAMDKAIRCVRARARHGGGPNLGIGWMHARHQSLQDSITWFATDYVADHAQRNLVVRANALKLQSSVDALQVAQMSLDICGMAGYSERGDASVSRNLRDLYSARLMIGNDKINMTNSELIPIGAR